LLANAACQLSSVQNLLTSSRASALLQGIVYTAR